MRNLVEGQAPFPAGPASAAGIQRGRGMGQPPGETLTRNVPPMWNEAARPCRGGSGPRRLPLLSARCGGWHGRHTARGIGCGTRGERGFVLTSRSLQAERLPPATSIPCLLFYESTRSTSRSPCDSLSTRASLPATAQRSEAEKSNHCVIRFAMLPPIPALIRTSPPGRVTWTAARITVTRLIRRAWRGSPSMTRCSCGVVMAAERAAWPGVYGQGRRSNRECPDGRPACIRIRISDDHNDQ